MAVTIKKKRLGMSLGGSGGIGGGYAPDVPAQTDFSNSIAMAHITVKHKDGAETEEVVKVNHEVQKKPIESAFKCQVGVNAQRTINLGNYESAKIGISLVMPCDAADVEQVYEFTKNWVSDKMMATMDEFNDTAPVKEAKAEIDPPF